MILFYFVVSSLGCKTNVHKIWFRNVENEEYNQLFDKQWHGSFREVRFKGLEYLWVLNVDRCGPGSAVGIATDYGPDGPGIESRWGEIFRRPDRPWGPPIPLYNGYRVFPGGKERSERDADPPPPSSAEV